MTVIANEANASRSAEAVEAEERWRVWQRRGFENEARVGRRFRRVLAVVITVAGVVLGWVATR